MTDRPEAEPTPTNAADAPSVGRRLGLVDLLRWILLAAVVVAVGYALVRNWGEVRDELSRLDAATVAGSLAFAVISPYVTMLGWRRLLADLGSPLHLAPAAGIFFVGQLGKYVPGSVWSLLAQMEMGARLGVPRRRAGVAGLVLIGLSVLTGGLVGLPAVPALFGRTGEGYPWWLVGVAALLAVVLLAPPVLNRLIALGLRLLRREPLEHDLSGRAILVATSWFVAAWVSMGASVWWIARSVAPTTADGGQLALLSISGFVLGATLGMVSFLVPAGVGIRDGVLLVLLSTVMPTSAAFAVAVLARFLSVVIDVAAAAFGWLWARTHHLLPERRADGAAG